MSTFIKRKWLSEENSEEIVKSSETNEFNDGSDGTFQ